MYKCYKCKQEKLGIEFHKDKSRSSGLSSKCKDCKRVINKEKRKTPEGKAKQVVASRRWKQANKIKERSHKRVAYAIKKGFLKKSKDCAQCGSSRFIEGHHPDYSKPLEVVWLCKLCHLNLHISKWKEKNAAR